MTAHSVVERTNEIGIRMALGARSSEVAWMFVKRTLAQLAVGVPLGLAGALATGQLLRRFLVNTPARDPVTLVAVALPARRDRADRVPAAGAPRRANRFGARAAIRMSSRSAGLQACRTAAMQP